MYQIIGRTPGDRPINADEFTRKVVHPDDAEAFSAALEQALATDSFHFTGRFKRMDGTLRWIEFTGQVKRGPDGTPVRMPGTAAAITERKQAEQAAQEADRRKDEFLATLAHELRNALAPLRNGLEVLRNNDPKTTDKARALMERQLGQLTRLVDDLLDVSRVTRGKVHLRLAPTDLVAVIREAVETTRPRVDTAGHTLTAALPDEAVPLSADHERLTQVLMNLITNASKYTPSGGRIEIALEQRDGRAVVSVRDNGIGIGIAADKLSGVFEMFRQADQPTGQTNEGLGIGLTLVKQVVELHGGTIAAHSDGPDQGSEFIMRLPLTTDEPAAAPEAGAAEQLAAPTQNSVLRLLVVDDNADVADSLGHEVQTVHDGVQALETITAFEPDAVFLDLGLPEIDGFETARRMRTTAAGRNMALIALTGWGRDEHVSRTTEAGFDHHLVKPVEPDALEQLLARL